MAEQYALADALGIFLTGAASDGGEQSDPDLSFGNYRSSRREEQIGFFINYSIPGVIIERVGSANGIGTGSLEVVGGNSLQWTAPDDAPGPVVAIANSETKMLTSGSNPSKFIIVSRNTVADLVGSATVILMPVFNNAIASSNVPGGEALVKLRCITMKNSNASAGITNLKVWLGTLGTQQVSNAGQLGASEAGTIETTGSFADWPSTGFCRISTAGGSLREIVYYSGRTATILTIPAAGRGLLGTSAAAGTVDDKIDAVPGIKIAKEPPSSGHFTIADDEHDTDAVSGLSWSTGIAAAGGLDVGPLGTGEMIGIWLWLAVVEGRTATPSIKNILKWSFTISATNLTGESGGLYRIADDTFERYELFRGINEEPDLEGESYETFMELPHITDGMPSTELFFVLRRRNKFNLSSLNIQSWSVKTDADGQVILPSPDAPQNVSIVPAAGAKGIVSAQYLFEDDDEYAATHWLIYFRDDGVAPDPDIDEPTVVEMSRVNGRARLQWTSPAADNGDTLKVLVRTRLVSGEDIFDSENTDIYSCTASDQGPTAPAGRAFLGYAAEDL